MKELEKIKQLSHCQERLELMRYNKIISKWEYKKISKKIRKELIKETNKIKERGFLQNEQRNRNALHRTTADLTEQI